MCLVGRRPWGEAVGEDVPAGRLVALGPGRRGGFFGLGTFDREGLFEVVGDGQCQRADGVCGETEGAAPSGFQAAFVLDHGKGFLDGVAAAVAPFPGGGAEGNVLVGIEQVGWDADLAVRALFD